MVTGTVLSIVLLGQMGAMWFVPIVAARSALLFFHQDRRVDEDPR